MIFKRNKRKWLVAVLLLMGLVPIILTAFEMIFTKDKSVVFLGGYHPKIAVLVISYYVLLLSFAVFWFVTQLLSINRLRNEKARAELTLLKSQINPHFFFNVLNNLYGMVAKDQKKAQELILRLSDIMRYTIYEGQKDEVSLEQEVAYLRSYIELHQMRYHKEIAVRFNYSMEGQVKVVPLLFIMLLENSFKHGVEKLRDNAYINVEVIACHERINFTVENNYEAVQDRGGRKGIGLENLKQRLEMLYPDKHKLVFSITENVYKVNLILNHL